MRTKCIGSTNGEILGVKQIFRTIQGEGPLAGMPAVFIRLGHCNLSCSFCDTDFSNPTLMSVGDIIAQVQALSPSTKLVILTGGEPFYQPITLLCETLLSRGFSIQIETNGMLFRPIPESITIVCSPKAGRLGYFPIHEKLLCRLSALKFLIAKNRAYYASIPDLGQYQYNIPIFLQPMEESDREMTRINTEYAVQLALVTGHRLSLQLHKILGIE